MPHIHRAWLVVCGTILCGCTGSRLASDPRNPIGWPAKVCSITGGALASTGLPPFRETGRVISAAGDLLETPALAVEGVVTLQGEKIARAGEALVVGTGGTVTASLNLPFFLFTGPNVDIAQDADLVNEALAYMENVPPEEWHTSPLDERLEVYPKGTRVRPSREGLVWSIPGDGEVLQVCVESPFFYLVEEIAGTTHRAQERSWGFIVSDADDWYARSPRGRAETICHEFYHQHMQIRRWFLAWSVAYWPAYGYTYLTKGWMGHWAEMNGPHAAGAVDLALGDWTYAASETDP